MKFRKFVHLLPILIIFACVIMNAPVHAKSARYVVQMPNEGDSGVVRCYDNRTHHVLGKIDNITVLSTACWSQDKRCMAMVLWDNSTAPHNDGTRLMSWCIGQKPHIYVGFPKAMDKQYSDPNIETDYIVDMAWSPDNRNLLITTTGSGGAYTEGFGVLWQVNPQHYRARLLVNSLISDASWVTSTRICYWEVNFQNPGLSKERWL